MENLKKLRRERNLSQAQLADMLGIARTSYTRYESGAGEMNYRLLVRLADTLETSVDVLLDRHNAEMFDDARVEVPEIMQVYRALSPHDRDKLVAYGKGLLAAREDRH